MSRQQSRRKMVSIILAAGKGTRLRFPYLHKVCFPLDGRPVIARSIEGYQRCGIDSHFVVVGPMAEQVMQAASLVKTNLYYCYQPEQRGTGNATRVAATLLASMGYDGDILVVMGDKVLEDSILTRLIGTFYEQDDDLAFVVGNVADFPASGRIIPGEDSTILGNVEVFDINRMRLLIALRQVSRERSITPQEAKSLALTYLKEEKKAARALGTLWDAVQSGLPVTRKMIESSYKEGDFLLRVNGKCYPPELLSRVEQANLSVYMFKAPALYAAIEKVGSDNGQGEEYLTDTIGILAAEGCRLDAVPLLHPQEAMAFNTPEELREIEEYLCGRKQAETPVT